jgi:hypothetical protein
MAKAKAAATSSSTGTSATSAPKTKANLVEVGNTGLKQSGGRIREEYLTELQGTRAAKIYREMAENDPIVGAFLFAVEQIMRQVDWKLVPASQEAGHVADALFVDQCREDMDITWGDFIAEALSMLTFGYAPFEIVYKLRNGPQKDPTKDSRFTDGKYGWRNFSIRSQETVESWLFEPETNRLLGFKQRTENKGTVDILMETMLLFKTKSIRENPEGRSILRNAYRPWYFKKKIEEVEGIGIERDLAGLPVITAPENLDIWNANDPQMLATKRAVEELIRNLRRDAQEGVLLPYGWDLKLLASEGQRNFDTTAVINRYDQRIAMTVLADFILLGHGGKFGSFALAKSKTSAFTLSIVGYLNVIRDVINRVAIPRLFRVNGLPTEMLPRLDYSSIEVAPLRELAPFLKVLNEMGVDLSDPNLVRHLLNLAGLPADLTDEAGGGGTGAQGKGKGKKKKGSNESGDKDTNAGNAKPEPTTTGE